ncbi:lipopolysaccharide biosynthesis protein [Salipiger mangrovisoli]|uniref:Lipopolysaccharide biosynthesis protein n=1 Tax=Salipiger mangrovisoli TaxID=2865933 RepID=A0ABR9X7U7_9RHOB|nr:lipopolysaccharide biosynthesis protein [Salipiger mangrovisoli]MBE9639613.1 lipopolysaccharide biosynthesis protein [Salipiger mangrovisoli]
MAFSPGKATKKNLLWAYLSFALTKGLNFVAVIIVTRYVAPAEFGLMAICLAIMGYFDIISRFGLGAALISAQERQEETAVAVFACGLISSGVMAFLMWQGAGPLAAIFDAPDLAPLLTAIAITLIIRASSMVHFSLLLRELGFRKKIIPDVTQGVAKGLISIALAIAGYGVWALIIGYVAGTIVASITLFIIRPWRPHSWPDLATMKHVMRYGSYLIGAETISATSRVLDNLLVGKFLGPAALGIYAISFRIPELAIKTFTSVAGSVLHPVMSRIQVNAEDLARFFYQALSYCALLVFGVGTAIAVLAGPMVHVLYTEDWYGMIEPMRLIALSFSVSVINLLPGVLLKTVGRTDLMFRVSLINLPFIALFLGVALPFGITAVAAAQLLLAFVPFWPTYVATKRVIDLSLSKVFDALRPALVCAGTASLAAVLVLHFLDGSELMRLLAGMAAYSCAYLIALRVQAPETFTAGARFLRHRLKLNFGKKVGT